jgi:Tol biopolymer transport system component
MKLRFTTVALLAAIAATAPAAEKPDQARVLMEAARKKEVVDGDLRGAIEQYKAIASKHAGARSVAAAALLRLADCYQKLGDTESRAVYERIMRDYSDQSEAVTVARKRLGPGGAAREQRGELALRKVWTGDVSGRVSADGRRMTYVNWSSPSWEIWGTLHVRELATGSDRVLVERGPSKGTVYTSAISRDASQVAYSWCVNQVCELRAVPIQGSGMPVSRTIFANEDVSFVSPMDWSPDGKWIAAFLQRKDRSGHIALIGATDGALRVLKSANWRGPENMFFSPDGRELAYDMEADDKSAQKDVFVLAVDGSRETRAVASPSNDLMMAWTPDGKRLLFASARSGTLGLWSMPLSAGKPQGSPELVKANIETVRSLGITAAGALYLGHEGSTRDIEISALDVAAGKQVGPSVRPIDTFVGTNLDPFWSRDGKFLSYRSRRGDRTVICIRSVETGTVREVPVGADLPWMVGVSWSPDQRYFLAAGDDGKGRHGIFRIDGQSGAVSPVAVPVPERLSYEGFSWSPDGQRVYYHSQKGTIYERDMQTGATREIAKGNYGPISLSPDGRWLATSMGGAFGVIPVAGGAPRELLRIEKPAWFNNIAMPWTPDSKTVLVRKMLVDGGKQSELWAMPVEANESPRKLEFDVNRIATYQPGKMRLHPDGRQLAYVFGESTSELWVLENFLPAAKANGAKATD